MPLTIQWSVAAVAPYANAEIDLPLGRYVEIDGREDLLLLIVEAGDVGDAAVVGVVFDPARNHLGDVPADFDCRCEVESEVHIRPVEGALERRVDGPVEATFLPIDNRTDLPRPGIPIEEGALIADLR